jgi:cytochrome c biogenesis protein CcmG, thiol:disulfide interchange protein DsbE
LLTYRKGRGVTRMLVSVLTVAAALTFVGAAHGAGLDLSAYRGKVVYLDFWASWCTPCRQSFPWLGGLVNRYGTKDLVVIGVNVDQNHELAEEFLNATPANFPIIYDPHGEIATAFKVMGMPSAVLLDRAGHVRFQHVGFSEKRKDEYETHVQSLLGEPASR